MKLMAEPIMVSRESSNVRFRKAAVVGIVVMVEKEDGTEWWMVPTTKDVPLEEGEINLPYVDPEDVKRILRKVLRELEKGGE